MKKRLMGLVVGACVSVTSIIAQPVTLVVDSQVVETRLAPINEAGTVLVPLREAGEALGAYVDYIAETQQVIVLKGYEQIVLQIDSDVAFINGETVTLAVAPKLIEGVAMVPIRLISEHMDCAIEWDQVTQTATIESKNAPHLLPIATITIQGLGEIKAELYPATAPNTVKNFVALANSGFYDGLTFHRVIEDFMIQGGCPQGNGMGGPEHTIEGEFIANGYVNMLPHTEGVLSMARTSDPNSAGSQFFIMTEQASYLDGEYAAFGQVIEGMSIVEALEGVETDDIDKPVAPVVIESIRIE